MRSISMISRLLWKELREGWLVVMIAAIAPPLIFKVASQQGPETKQVLQFMVSICSLASIVIWAVLKGERLRNEEKLPLAHLPANVILERMVSLGLPLIISAFAGAWFGRTFAVYAARGPVEHYAVAAAAMFALWGALAFAACCLISATISSWASIAVGIAWIIVGMGMRESIPSIRYIGQGPWDYMIRSCVTSIACLALFLVLSHKRRLRFAWAPPLVLLAAIMLGPLVVELIHSSQEHRAHYVTSLISSDGAVQAGQIIYSQGRSTLLYTNRMTMNTVRKSFDGMTIPIAVDNRGFAYLVQCTKRRNLHVISWDGRNSRRIADIPGRRDLLEWSYSRWRFSSISPDRRYVLFSTGSQLGRGSDLWVVDVSAREAWIVVPNQLDVVERASWLGNRVALSGRSPRIQIADLHTRKTSVLRIPGATEVEAR